MFDDHVPDMSCVPYGRKSLYLILTLPFLGILVLVAIYLWRFSPWLTVAVVLCHLWTCFFQAYWCAAQNCPYVGRFCPAVAGIVPASWMAKWIYGSRNVHGAKAKLELCAVSAILGMVGWTVIPVWWIAKINVGLAVVYVAWQLVYVVIFWLTICPVCAIRETCPGGVLHRRCHRRGER